MPLTIPRWFLWIMSACTTIFLATFVPWASWVTVTLVAISVRMEAMPRLEARVEQLAAERREE